MDETEEKNTSTDVTKEERKGEWNSKLEEAAQGIGQHAQGYKHMHIWQAQLATDRHKYLIGGGIVIGPLTSLLSSIGLALHLGDDPVISVLVIILGFLSGILVATVKFGKYDEVSNANKSAAARYTSIEANVRRQLGLYRRDRMPAISYMDWLETKYEELLLSAPLLSASALQRYSQHAKAKGLPIPEQYDHLISINEDYEANKAKEIVDRSEIQVTIHDDDTDSKGDTNPSPRSSEGCEQSLPVRQSQLKRSSVMAKIPEINCASDKMLSYEMNRLMGIR
jgi:hypothetical protein